jgi:hypothetical protein
MRKLFEKSVIAALVLAASATAAGALPPIIEDAKSKCVVGEQADGYLGVVAGAAASDAVRREVRAINQARKAKYAELAASNGVTIEDAAALTGEQRVEGAASGECVQLPDGSWAKQP